MPSRITNTDESRPELRQKPTKSGGQTQTEQRNTGREAQNQRRRAKYIPTGPFHVTTDRASKNKKGKERGKGTVNSKHHARSAHQAPPERRQRRKSEGREKKERERRAPIFNRRYLLALQTDLALKYTIRKARCPRRRHRARKIKTSNTERHYI